MRVLIISLFVLSGVLYGDNSNDLDLVGTDEALYICWNNQMEIYNTGISRSFSSTSVQHIGLATLDGAEVIVHSRAELYSLTDSLFILDPVDLEIIATAWMRPEDFALLSLPDIADMCVYVSRHQPYQDSFHISADPSILGSGLSECNIVSARMDYSDTQGIIVGDTLGADMDIYYGYVRGYTRPVCTSISLPMLFWNTYGGYVSFGGTNYAGLHEMDGDPVPGDFNPMLYDSFYSYSGGPVTPSKIAGVGSSSSDIIVVYTECDYQSLQYCLFDGTGVSYLVREPVSFIDDPYAPVALSCNPADDGLLLVWAEENEIRCRHWYGEWNDWTYKIDDFPGAIEYGEIAVCSVTDGYWVAWLQAGGEALEVRFVSLGSVMSIEDTEYEEVTELKIYPNPCHGLASISVMNPSEHATVSIFDLSGRLVETVQLDAQGKGSWDSTGCDPGTFYIRAVSGTEVAIRRLVVL